jgi:hypothetical protein
MSHRTHALAATGLLVAVCCSVPACGGGGGGGGSGVTSFRHLTATANIGGNSTFLDHPALNGNPDAILIVNHVYTETYPNRDDTPYGVWYTGAEWAIFHQDVSPMPADLEWSVIIPGSDEAAFVHTATVANIGSSETYIDHPALNGHPEARFVATQFFGPVGVYNAQVIGCYYHSGLSQWALFNESGAAMPVGASFHVVVPPASRTFLHVAAASNMGLNWTNTSDPLGAGPGTDNPAHLHVIADDAVSPPTTGLWFNDTQWAIYTEDVSPIPVDHQYFFWRP